MNSILTLQNEILLYFINWIISLQWRHNGHDVVSNHKPQHCLRKRFFRRRSKTTSKFRVTGLCGEITIDRWIALNVENVSIWWRHYDRLLLPQMYTWHSARTTFWHVTLNSLSSETYNGRVQGMILQHNLVICVWAFGEIALCHGTTLVINPGWFRYCLGAVHVTARRVHFPWWSRSNFFIPGHLWGESTGGFLHKKPVMPCFGFEFYANLKPVHSYDVTKMRTWFLTWRHILNPISRYTKCASLLGQDFDEEYNRLSTTIGYQR